MRSIVFTGGGTGGHIYPGLAVADELRIILNNEFPGEKFVFIWIGANNRRDSEIVNKSGTDIKFYSIPSGKLRRYFSLKNFTDIFKILAGFVKAFFLLAKIKPVFLFSKGGFVSVPPCFAARLLHIPVYTHECDYSPGLATRLNVKAASKIFISYEETKKFFSELIQNKIIVSGNPVRPMFYNANAEKGRSFLKLDSTDKTEKKLPVLLVLGGSLGARQINELIWNNIDWLCERFIIVHQTGKTDYEESTKITPANPKAVYLKYAFIYEQMSDVIAASDIVISRSGANFLCECAVVQKPLLLIPLSTQGSRGDQIENARFFKERGAALVLEGKEVTNDNFKTSLEKLSDINTRKSFCDNCKKITGEEKPAFKIAKILFEENIK
jgi:UDP-N-acetylglucosamine--N-acetylmuramyl-(pentapeptide) pyrophosphoryl-undecaprenol N-acetylglucosamine transferase